MMRALAFACSLIVHGSWAQDTLSVSLVFTGDIMQHDSQIAAAFKLDSSGYNYKPCFEFVKSHLSAADIAFGNLELTLGGPPYKGYPEFSAPDEIMDALKDSGFDVLVTANNHCVDRGRSGLERTIDLLDSAGILHTGTFKDTLDWLNNYPLIISAKGFRFSLLNYTYGTNGLAVSEPNLVNRIDTLRIKADLQKATQQNTDAIIVFMHWGQEYQSAASTFQKNLADFCLLHGARIVIGSHPHVLQPMEWRKAHDQVIAYSLGNFLSGQRDRYRNGGAVLNIDLQKIVHPDSMPKVIIKDVSYTLSYVHRARDTRRTYQIIPIRQFEADSTLVQGKSARASLIQFRDDTRLFYLRENKEVKEKLTSANELSNHH